MRNKFLSALMFVAVVFGFASCKKDGAKKHYSSFRVKSVKLLSVDWFDPIGNFYSSSGSYIGQLGLRLDNGNVILSSDRFNLIYPDSGQFPKVWEPSSNVDIPVGDLNTLALFSVDESGYTSVATFDFKGSSEMFSSYPVIVTLNSRKTAVALELDWH